VELPWKAKVELWNAYGKPRLSCGIAVDGQYWAVGFAVEITVKRVESQG